MIVNAPVEGSVAKPTLASGIHLQSVDAAIRPQDDFYSYVNGKWLAQTQIPEDKSEASSFTRLDDTEQEQLRALVEDAARDAAPTADANRRKIGELFGAFMDEAQLQQRAMQPLAAEFARIDGLRRKSEIAALLARYNEIGVRIPYGASVGQDARDSTKYVVGIDQGGLGLPDRDYYLQNDAKLVQIRGQYRQHVEKMLTLAGSTSAAADAQAILQLETRLAQAQWTKVENRDPVKTYNKVELAKLAGLMPGYEWRAYLKAADLEGKIDYVIVSQPSYLSAFNKILDETPLAVWQAYFRWQLLASFAPYLS
jgi:putative endopeptidase